LIDNYSDMLRERELAEYDAVLATYQLVEFERNPEKILNAWNRRRTADRILETLLEEEYINSVRQIEHAATRDVKNNDTYLGRDGAWYIVKYQNGEYRKYRYYPQKKSGNNVDPKPLRFDPVEYDEYWTEREKTVAELEKIKKANENMQTGNVTPTPEEPTESAPVEIIEPEKPEGGPEPFIKQHFVEG
jgi:hypothetical protein